VEQVFSFGERLSQFHSIIVLRFIVFLPITICCFHRHQGCGTSLLSRSAWILEYNWRGAKRH